MLSWAITFFLLAVVAAVFGFGGIAGTLSSAAQLLFVGFVILFLATLIANVITGRKTNSPL